MSAYSDSSALFPHPAEYQTDVWHSEGTGQVLLSALFDWVHCACPCPALTQSVLPVLPANSSGKGWALMLLNWMPQLEAPRLCRLSRERQYWSSGSVISGGISSGPGSDHRDPTVTEGRSRVLRAHPGQYHTYISPLELQAWKKNGTGV